MKLEQVRYEILVEAVTPIAHAEGTMGNHSLAMARKIRQRDGSFVRVPIITGDTMRHKLREAVTYVLLDAAGLLTGEGPQLTASALRLLFNGGMLTGKGSGSAVKLTEWRDMMRALPSLGLFGGCVNSHLIPGQMSVSDALLVCTETEHMIPAWVVDYCKAEGATLQTFRAHMDEEQRVRMDSTREPQKVRLLSAGERDAVERRQIASELAHDENDAVAKEVTKSSMLPRTREVVAPGSLFYWDVTATVYDALERDMFDTAVAAFLANAVVGGGSNTGHGRLRGVVGNEVKLARPSEASEAMDLSALSARKGDVFRAHVREHAATMRKVLSEVDA